MKLEFISIIYSFICAVLYKLTRLFFCEQNVTPFCMSSEGNIFYDESDGTYIRREDNIKLCLFHALHNSSHECQPVTVDPKIKKIISWNVQELWWHCYRGHKINNIVQYLIQSDADVLCLQEVFELSSLHKIIYNVDIYKKFPYFLTGNLGHRFVIGETSGLLVLSKYPITFQTFRQLPVSVWPDIFAAKGALSFTVADHNFMTTHLQSDNINIALQQLSAISRSCPFNKDYILLGDLNFATPGTLFEVISNNMIATCDNGEVLDHIIPVLEKPMDIYVDKINLTDVSDHWPIVATFL